MNSQKNDDAISQILSDTDKIIAIIQSGIHAALLKHKQAGNPICEWKNNKVVWVPADKI